MTPTVLRESVVLLAKAMSVNHVPLFEFMYLVLIYSYACHSYRRRFRSLLHRQEVEAKRFSKSKRKFKVRHQNDENLRLDSENCFASSFLSSSFLPSPFILFYPSSDTRRRPKVESARVFHFLCV